MRVHSCECGCCFLACLRRWLVCESELCELFPYFCVVACHVGRLLLAGVSSSTVLIDRCLAQRLLRTGCYARRERSTNGMAVESVVTHLITTLPNVVITFFGGAHSFPIRSYTICLPRFGLRDRSTNPFRLAVCVQHHRLWDLRDCGLRQQLYWLCSAESTPCATSLGVCHVLSQVCAWAHAQASRGASFSWRELAPCRDAGSFSVGGVQSRSGC
jgi:hypothetical protein